MPYLSRRLFLAVLLLFLQPAARSADLTGEALWSALSKGNYILLIRHAATEPGVGDPAGFVVERCETQRNLSQRGRDDARRLGAAFTQRKIPVAAVLSSRWCRCLDTARLAFGRVEPALMLDSMFNDPGPRTNEEKMREVMNYVGKRPADSNLVFVTHAQNIGIMTGVYPDTSEIVVALPEGGKLKAIGRLKIGAN